MKTLPPFRTFVNAFGTSPCNLLWPVQTHQPLWVPRQHISTWYWLLCDLTLEYDYVINDYPIHHKIHIDGSRWGLKERIQGGWMFATPAGSDGLEGVLSDSELGLTTEFKLYLCQIYDAQQTLDPNARYTQYETLLQAQPLLCSDATLPEQYPLGILLYFSEKADNGDFILTANPNLAEKTILQTQTVPFMNSQLTFSLSTPIPEEITGQINTISLTPEFFSIEPP